MPTAANSAIYPEYLSPKFFAKALAYEQPHRNADDLDVVDVLLSAGSQAGENYCSEIYRARVQYRWSGSEAVKAISLIVKSMPFSAIRGPMLDELRVFEKEVRMYTETLPKLSAILGGRKLSPKYFYSQASPVPTIVFEDLTVADFHSVDRTVGLDIAHCDLVLRQLGELHAASMLLVERERQSMDLYSFGFFKDAPKLNVLYEEYYTRGYETVMNMVATWSGYEETAKRMQPILNNYLRKMRHHCNHTPSDYKVLNHGDLWTNNLMFKYDAATRQPIDVCFIDYQMTFYTSPGIDLNYFLHTSPTHETRAQHGDHLLDVYVAAFTRVLDELDGAAVSADRVRNEIRSRAFYGLAAATAFLPLFMKVENGEAATLDALADPELALRIRLAMYQNPRYVQAIRGIVRRFDADGVFDAAPEC